MSNREYSIFNSIDNGSSDIDYWIFNRERQSASRVPTRGSHKSEDLRQFLGTSPTENPDYISPFH